MSAHPFRDSGYRTLMTEKRICGSCGNLEASPVHELPQTPVEAVEIDARVLGERSKT